MKITINERQLKNIVSKILFEEKNNSFRELTPEEESNAFASFVVVKLPDGKIAATTRPYEKSKNKKIGLPGGKVEKGETPKQAAYRESKEEGWDVEKIGNIIASKKVNGKVIVYFIGYGAKKLDDYIEKENDIEAIAVSIEEISNTGYGNDFIEKYFSSNQDIDEQEAAATSTTSTSSTPSSSGAQGYPDVGKWESGVTRGPGNQIGVTKWSDIVGAKLTRGKANPLK
jgi:ADP-ribose pyrophosphatase YjhB (NUDIX family)